MHRGHEVENNENIASKMEAYIKKKAGLIINNTSSRRL